MKSWLFIIVWVLILSYNAIYSFLPAKYQSATWFKVTAIIASIMILLHGIYAIIEKQNNEITSTIKVDGQFESRKNFPWEIVKNVTEEGDLVYMFSELRIDVSQVKLETECPQDKIEKYMAFGGVAIKFKIKENEMKSFKLKVKNSL